MRVTEEIKAKPGVVAVRVSARERLTDEHVAALKRAFGSHVVVIAGSVRLEQLDEQQMLAHGWVRALK